MLGWVSLDRLDDDPGILLAVLASAYVRMFPAGAGLVADVSGLGVSALGRAAPVRRVRVPEKPRSVRPDAG